MRESKQRKLNHAFDTLAELIRCDDKCNKECPLGGYSECPLNQFRYKIEDAIERR